MARILLAEDDDNLRRAGGKVDRDVSGDQQLGLVHVRIAGTDDLVDAGDRLGSVRKGGDGRRPADRPHLFESEQLGGGGDEPAPAGGVVTTIRSTPATWAGTAHMTSVETSPRGT